MVIIISGGFSFSLTLNKARLGKVSDPGRNPHLVDTVMTVPPRLNRVPRVLDVSSVRTGFPFRSDCQSEVDLGSAYRLAPQSLGP